MSTGRVFLTFVRPVRCHIIYIFELAVEGGLEVWVRREHALPLCIVKAVP